MPVPKKCPTRGAPIASSGSRRPSVGLGRGTRLLTRAEATHKSRDLTCAVFGRRVAVSRRCPWRRPARLAACIPRRHWYLFSPPRTHLVAASTSICVFRRLSSPHTTARTRVGTHAISFRRRHRRPPSKIFFSLFFFLSSFVFKFTLILRPLPLFSSRLHPSPTQPLAPALVHTRFSSAPASPAAVQTSFFLLTFFFFSFFLFFLHFYFTPIFLVASLPPPFPLFSSRLPPSPTQPFAPALAHTQFSSAPASLAAVQNKFSLFFSSRFFFSFTSIIRPPPPLFLRFHQLTPTPVHSLFPVGMACEILFLSSHA